LAKKVSQIIQDTEAQTEFYDKVEQASRGGAIKVWQAAKRQLRSEGTYYLTIALHVVLLILLASLPLYFDSWLKPTFQVFSNVDVDSGFFAGALGAIVVVLMSLANRWNKR
jgi:hypothetical protein